MGFLLLPFGRFVRVFVHWDVVVWSANTNEWPIIEIVRMIAVNNNRANAHTDDSITYVLPMWRASKRPNECSDKILRRSSFETFSVCRCCLCVVKRWKSKSGITSIGSVGGSDNLACSEFLLQSIWRFYMACDDCCCWIRLRENTSLVPIRLMMRDMWGNVISISLKTARLIIIIIISC